MPGRSKLTIFPVSQTLGGTFVLAAGQSVFAKNIISTLPTSAPGADASIVMATGA